MKAPPRATCAVVIVAIATTASIAACRARAEEPKPLTSCRAATTGITKTTFHGSAARLGWSSVEPDLAPASVARGMSTAWTSPPFATFDVNGTTYPGRAYASPLYADGIRIQKGAAAGNPLSVIFVATSNGDVYAISAFDAGCTEGLLEAGTILWQTHLVSPGVPPKLDGRDDHDPRFPAIAVGTVSTPVLDLAAKVPVLYVTAMEAGTAGGPPVWKAFALDVATGDVVSGWPVVLERHAVEARNTNAPADLERSGKYVTPIVAHGTVFVATDRLHAFTAAP